MSNVFDHYHSDYSGVVEQSISFSGLKHDFFMQAKAKRIQAAFEAHFGDYKPSLADIGCGVGVLHPALRSLCSSISGCDTSAPSVAEAQRANPGASYVQSAIGALPWENDSFDSSLAVCVMHHVEREDRAAFMAEMKRITRPGGLMMVIEHNPLNPLTRLAVARCPLDAGVKLLMPHETHKWFRGADAHNARSEHFLMLPFDGAISSRVEKTFAKLPFGAQYIATAIA